MQVEYGLSRLSSVVDDGSEGLADSLLLGDFGRGDEQSTQDLLIFVGSGRQSRKMTLWNQQNMGRGLRIDVPKRQSIVILPNHICFHFLVCDLTENAVSHFSSALSRMLQLARE